jgi:moderate conductance mechanosensitive channel
VRFKFLGITSAMVIAIISTPKATAQIPIFQNLPTPIRDANSSENQTITQWIYLDGRQLFQVVVQKNGERSQNIQRNLDEMTQDYVRSVGKELDIKITERNGLPVIYVNNKYLMTVISNDAELRQSDPLTLANQIAGDLQENLKKAKAERQSQYLISQGKKAGGIALTMILSSLLIYRWQRRSLKKSKEIISVNLETDESLSSQLNQQKHEHLLEVKKRLFQLTQTGIWASGSFVILGMFPYTRPLQIAVLTVAQIPLKIGIVGLGTYLAIRFSYILIDQFTTTIISGGVVLNSANSERTQLRLSTFSGVTKSITTLLWIGIGILIALIALGIDIVPLLAGAGLIGVAISLASQNLIKDAINGFLIILEDQYALGDVINVGDVGGLVENLNLRMTQLRDAEGRLITIPNSEVKIVANLSSRWSRADLTIPVSYQANIDEALKLITDVAVNMSKEPFWKRQIMEKPTVLGIDNFSDRGMMIRVWIKTQPIKQWDVGREYRRRLKIAFDQAGISIPVPQQEIWLNNHHANLLSDQEKNNPPLQPNSHHKY